MTADIAGIFNAQFTPIQVLHRAGLVRLNDGRFTWPTARATHARSAWIRPNPDGRTATASWPGLCFHWDPEHWPAWKPNDQVTPFDIFRVLICDGDPADATRRALKIPEVRAQALAIMGSLAHV